MSDSRKCYEGVRVKPLRQGEQYEAYNNQGSVLRVETIVNDTRSFTVFHHPNDDSTCPMSWLPIRKGVADLDRRAEISDGINKRYADHITAADTNECFGEVVGKVCRKASLSGRDGRSYKGRAAPKIRLTKGFGVSEEG